ncbi:MAG TPA: ABC transporter permease [Steroidobacteraceae bacterium]|nr:ABC transporter permease [Steroidobacteraceae bacterium]
MLRKIGLFLGAVACIVVPIAVLTVLPWWLLAIFVVLLGCWMAFTRTGTQTWSVTQVGIATIPQRLGSSAVVVVGIAGVVGVLVALLAMGAGFAATLRQTGADDTAIVIRAGAQTELNSVLDHNTATLVAQAPQVLKNAQGDPIASPELVVVASLPKKANGLDANVEIRGIGERAWELRPNVKIIAGRKFGLGLRELIVGKGAAAQFAGLDLGSSLKLNGEQWTVVGEFDSGDANNSDLWGDTAVVGSAYRRGSSTTSVTVRLTDAAAFDAFKAGLASDRRLQVDVFTTRNYYNTQAEGLTRTIRVLGTTVGIIMAIGAVFGALNTMYAAVATRTREIATLRAIGFRAVPVIVSVLLETVLLAVLGGVLGAAIAWALFDNYTASTLGSNFSQVVFAFHVTPELLWNGLKWALAIGVIGGLFPAIRAARMPVTAGLREM